MGAPSPHQWQAGGEAFAVKHCISICSTPHTHSSCLQHSHLDRALLIFPIGIQERTGCQGVRHGKQLQTCAHSPVRMISRGTSAHTTGTDLRKVTFSECLQSASFFHPSKCNYSVWFCLLLCEIYSINNLLVLTAHFVSNRSVIYSTWNSECIYISSKHY